MTHWYDRRFRLHSWYIALVVLWLLSWGGFSLLMFGFGNASGQVSFFDLASGLVREIASLPRQSPLLGTFFAFTFFLPLLAAPFGLTEPVFTE